MADSARRRMLWFERFGGNKCLLGLNFLRSVWGMWMVDSVVRDFLLKSFEDDNGEAEAAGRNCGVGKSLGRSRDRERGCGGGLNCLLVYLSWRSEIILILVKKVKTNAKPSVAEGDSLFLSS
ncbi:UNVERIFIED_CONTAM: hypothetical protein Sangu_1684000 [Sesamum angustifolium]|uniref:Uncharacterized protein n=1 Tax=Sesamum angustifolium TaxID=2727405 RepID=A0AAW2MJ47_9LAMI